MTLAPNLTLRLTSLLIVGFVLVQASLWAAMVLPDRGERGRPYNLPSPAQVAAMAAAVEAAPPAGRGALVEAFGGSLYSVGLTREAPAAARAPSPALQSAYAAALPGRRIVLSTRRPGLGRLFRNRPVLANLLAPVSLSVSLADGERLVIDSGASRSVRAYFRGRAVLAALGGLFVLALLAVAVQRTAQPLVRLSDSIRRFASDLDAPDLPVTGSRELRALSAAFNAMKARIGGLMAERTRILAAVAHDLRTYLTRLRLRAEFIEDPEQRAKAAADLAEMSALIDDTLLFARQDRGPDLHLERLDLAVELAEIAALRVELGEAVAFEAPREALVVRASRVALRRMLANLIDNGLRHGESVEVAARQTPSGVEVTVADDGPGAPEAALARLGEPFLRLDPSRDRQTGGAGLGLAIVKALAERQGAAVRFENRPQGGFLATLKFPAEG